MKKFKRIDGESSTSGSSIKIEPAFLAANGEALLAAGYTKTKVGVTAMAGRRERHGSVEGQDREQQ